MKVIKKISNVVLLVLIASDFSKSFGGISFKNGHIYLSKSFCKDVLNLVSSFFNEIFKSGYFKYEDTYEDL